VQYQGFNVLVWFGVVWVWFGFVLDLIWPMLEKMGSGSKPFQNHFGPCRFEKVQAGPKGVWNLTPVFHFGPCWKKRSQVPNPFKIIFGTPNYNLEAQNNATNGGKVSTTFAEPGSGAAPQRGS